MPKALLWEDLSDTDGALDIAKAKQISLIANAPADPKIALEPLIKRMRDVEITAEKAKVADSAAKLALASCQRLAKNPETILRHANAVIHLKLVVDDDTGKRNFDYLAIGQLILARHNTVSDIAIFDEKEYIVNARPELQSPAADPAGDRASLYPNRTPAAAAAAPTDPHSALLRWVRMLQVGLPQWTTQKRFTCIRYGLMKVVLINLI